MDYDISFTPEQLASIQMELQNVFFPQPPAKRGHNHTHQYSRSNHTHSHNQSQTPTAPSCPSVPKKVRFSAVSLISPQSDFVPQEQLVPLADNTTMPEICNFSAPSPIPSYANNPSPCTTPNTTTTTILEDFPNSSSSSSLNIGQLFPEILTQIFSHLEKKDRARVAQTCSYFNQILKNRQIWKDSEARLNLRPNQPHTYHSLQERGVVRVQVLSLKRSLRELTSHIRVTHLRLSGCYNVTDYSLNSMQILPSLVELDLSLCKQITDAGLVHILGKAPNLLRLDLGGCCNLTDRAPLLISYGLRTLQSLDLRSCYNLTDKALSYLAGEVHLSDRHEIKTYNFLARIGLIDCELCRSGRPSSGSSSSSKNRIELCKINETTEFGMLSLQSLVLQDCQKISDLSLQFIARLRSLSHLNLSFCVNITDNGLKHLKELGHSLTELNLRSCDNISDAGFLNLRDCGSLRNLDVSFCEKITTLNPSVCRMLKSLGLSACEIGDDAFSGIQMDQLETLNLGQCSKLSDRGLMAISEKCGKLKYIDLYGCSGISTKGLQAVMRMPSLKNVNLGLWKV